MEHHSVELLQRNEENLRFITDRARRWHETCAGIEEQKVLLEQIAGFFMPEIEEAMKYTGKLPSFRNCGGKEARMELLKQEAELVIWEQLVCGPEQSEDFEACMKKFRKAIRETLLQFTQTAQKESYHVEVRRDRRSGENEKCTIISGKKDITDETAGTRFGNEFSSEDTEEDLMDRKMGPYRPF